MKDFRRTTIWQKVSKNDKANKLEINHSKILCFEIKIKVNKQ